MPVMPPVAADRRSSPLRSSRSTRQLAPPGRAGRAVRRPACQARIAPTPHPPPPPRLLARSAARAAPLHPRRPASLSALARVPTRHRARIARVPSPGHPLARSASPLLPPRPRRQRLRQLELVRAVPVPRSRTPRASAPTRPGRLPAGRRPPSPSRPCHRGPSPQRSATLGGAALASARRPLPRAKDVIEGSGQGGSRARDPRDVAHASGRPVSR